VAALGIVGAAVAVALTRADASAVRRPGGESTAAVLARLAELPHPIRHGAPRLSLDAPGADPEHTRSRAAGPARTFRLRWTAANADDTSTAELARLAALVSSRAAGRRDPLALHAAALVDLRWGDARAVVRASAELEHALRLLDGTAAPASAAALHADLAAASLLRADGEGDARRLLVAVEHAHRALRLDPTSLAARYNLALALRRFGVGNEASGAGRQYLARDSTSRWARAVRAALRDTASPARNGPQVGAISPHASERDAPSPDPLDLQARREAGWEVHLPAWGAATLAHDTAAAARHLRAAAALGAAVRAAGGDASLTDMVEAIAARRPAAPAARAAATTTTTTTTTTGHARAVVAYASGLASYRASEYEVAAIALGRVTRTASAPAPLRAWARLYLGAALAHAGHLDPGAHELRRVIATADAGRYPALVGRAYASLGTAVARKGLDGELRAAVAAAEPLLARAHEPENLAAVRSLGADGAFVRGDAAEGYALTRRVLHTVGARSGSPWRHNALYVVAEEAAADGLPLAAADLHAEAVAGAAAVGRRRDQAEALLARARFRLEQGDGAGAGADLAAARHIIPSLPPGRARDWRTADRQLTEALAALSTRPAAAVRVADSTVAFFASTGNVLRLVPALAVRAAAHTAGGAPEAAIADLSRAALLLDDRAARLVGAGERGLLLRTARHVIDRAVLLRAAHGDADGALAMLEWARELLASRRRHAPSAGAPTDAPTDAPGAALRRPALRRGELGVAYWRVADTLLVWTAAHGRPVRLRRQRVDGERLRATVAQLSTLLEARSPEAEVRPLLQELHDVLLRPVLTDAGRRDAGGDVRSLVIVADGELAAVPFAALHDRRAARYVVETLGMRFAESFRRASEPTPRVAAAPARVLVLANPAFAPAAYPGLPALAHAAAEGADVASVYVRATALAGAAATDDAVRAALPHVDVVHYAGHAVFDAARPERSAFVLAGASGTRLRAAEIARLDLARTRLVVLSACQTMGPPTTRSVGSPASPAPSAPPALAAWSAARGVSTTRSRARSCPRSTTSTRARATPRAPCARRSSSCCAPGAVAPRAVGVGRVPLRRRLTAHPPPECFMAITLRIIFVGLGTFVQHERATHVLLPAATGHPHHHPDDGGHGERFSAARGARLSSAAVEPGESNAGRGIPSFPLTRTLLRISAPGDRVPAPTAELLFDISAHADRPLRRGLLDDAALDGLLTTRVGPAGRRPLHPVEAAHLQLPAPAPAGLDGAVRDVGRDRRRGCGRAWTWPSSHPSRTAPPPRCPFPLVPVTGSDGRRVVTLSVYHGDVREMPPKEPLPPHPGPVRHFAAYYQALRPTLRRTAPRAARRAAGREELVGARPEACPGTRATAHAPLGQPAPSSAAARR
jgi:hypothetical protein